MNEECWIRQTSSPTLNNKDACNLHFEIRNKVQVPHELQGSAALHVTTSVSSAMMKVVSVIKSSDLELYLQDRSVHDIVSLVEAQPLVVGS